MLTIAICTYRRDAQLEVLLTQLLEYAEWLRERAEVIVIDNAVSPALERRINKLREKLGIRYVPEPTLGLANARNRALQTMRGKAILFVDDDTNLSKSTVNCYIEALEEFSDTDYFGGRIQVDWQEARPAWLKSDDLVLLNGLFGHYDLGEDVLLYSEQSLGPFGANFVLTAEAIRRVGLFNPELGVNGDSLGRGEESDYFQRCSKLGGKGIYLPDAVVGHRFQLERISLKYLFDYGVAKGVFHARTFSGESPSWMKETCKQALLGALQLLKLRRDRFYQCVINMGIAVGMARYNKLSAS